MGSGVRGGWFNANDVSAVVLDEVLRLVVWLVRFAWFLWFFSLFLIFWLLEWCLTVSSILLYIAVRYILFLLCRLLLRLWGCSLNSGWWSSYSRIRLFHWIMLFLILLSLDLNNIEYLLPILLTNHLHVPPLPSLLQLATLHHPYRPLPLPLHPLLIFIFSPLALLGSTCDFGFQIYFQQGLLLSLRW